LYEKEKVLDGQTSQAKLSSQPVNLPGARHLIGSICSNFVSQNSLPHTTAGSLVYPLYFLTNHSQASNQAGFPVIG